MTRTDFLKSIGFTGTALLTALSSCRQEEVLPFGATVPQGPVDFTLDLTDSLNAPLRKKGGFVVTNGVVVAQSLRGTFVAASQFCRQDNGATISFANDRFYCPVHGARFDTEGNGLNSAAKSGLTVYRVEQRGFVLWIHS